MSSDSGLTLDEMRSESSGDEAGASACLTSSMMLDTASSGDEPLTKKPKLATDLNDVTINEHLEATEETALRAIILSCFGVLFEDCMNLSAQLYESIVEGMTTLVYLLFEKADLYRIGRSRMVYEQQNRFWEELADLGEKGESIYEICKWIFHRKIDRERYSLLNEHDLGDMLSFYRTFPYEKPYKNYNCFMINFKSAFDDDIQKAIKKVKRCHQRLTVDQYTLLLIELFRDCGDAKCQEFLLAKAVEIIDIEALYPIDADSLYLTKLVLGDTDYPHDHFEWMIKFHLIKILILKKRMVKDDSVTAQIPFIHLLFEENPKLLPVSAVVYELCEVAELRRRAEGSPFINRDHLIWAFDERGCELPIVYKDMVASRTAAENHPPYHIYVTAFALSKAEQEVLQFEHLAFAVVFGNSFGFSNEEVEKVKADFHDFKTALSMHGVSAPKDLSELKKESYFLECESSEVKTVKWFKDRLKEGLWDKLVF